MATEYSITINTTNTAGASKTFSVQHANSEATKTQADTFVHHYNQITDSGLTVTKMVLTQTKRDTIYPSV